MFQLREGDDSVLVEDVKRILGVFPADRFFTRDLVHRVRGFQQVRGIKPTGVVDKQTWEALGLGGEW